MGRPISNQSPQSRTNRTSKGDGVAPPAAGTGQGGKTSQTQGLRTYSTEQLAQNPASHGSDPGASHSVNQIQRGAASQVTGYSKKPVRKPYNAAADVKALDTAMAGMGTDEDAIFNVLKGKTPDQRAAIKKAYKARTGRELSADLKDELSGSEYNKAKAYLTQGRETEADRIRNAVEGAGTDENTVFRMLEGKTQSEVTAIKAEYKKKYGESLDSRLADEMSGSDLVKAKNLLKGEPEGDPSIKDPKAREADRVRRVGEKSAELLVNAMDGAGTDESTVLDTLHGKSDSERAAIRAAYKKKTGRELGADLTSEMSGSDLKIANSYLESGRESAADKIHRASDGAGTDEKLIMRTLEGMKPEERQQMLAEYKKKHGRSLQETLNDELSGADKAQALALLKDGKLNTRSQIEVAMAGAGTDEDAIYSALQKAKPEERQALMNDKTFMERLDSELSGSEKVKALELLKNGKLDTRGALDVAMTGAGTDEDGIYDALKSASADERRAIQNDPKMMDRLRDELSDSEFARAQELLKNGKLSTATQLDDAMGGAGTDEKGLYDALEGASESERAKLKADPKFRARLRSELSGSELERAERILENGPLSAKEKVAYASDGMGTDEKAIFESIEKAGPKERAALLKDEAFLKTLRSELSGADLERAELLLANGKTSDVENLHLAMQGAGTDEDAIFKVLNSLKSDEDREKLVQDYRDRHGKDLLSDLKSDLSSSEYRRAEQALRSKPKSVEEAMDRVHDDMARDRDGGGWTAVSSGFVDTFTDRGRDLDDHAREMRLAERQARQAGALDKPGTLDRINGMGEKFDVKRADYHEAKESIARAADVTLSVIASTAVAVGTMGAGIPFSTLMIGSAIGGVSKVALNKAILGQDYDATGYDGVTGFAAGATEILTSYGGSALAGHLVKGKTVMGGVYKGAISGGFSGGSGATVATALDDGTWDNGLGHGLGTVMEKGLWGGLIGAGVGGAFDGAWSKGWQATVGRTASGAADLVEDGVVQGIAGRIAEGARKAETPIRRFITGAPKSAVKKQISHELEE
jgi:annexin A7/11